MQVDFALCVFECVILVISFVTFNAVVELREVKVDERISIWAANILLSYRFDAQIVKPSPDRVDDIVFLFLVPGMVRKHTIEVLLFPVAFHSHS